MRSPQKFMLIFFLFAYFHSCGSTFPYDDQGFEIVETEIEASEFVILSNQSEAQIYQLPRGTMEIDIDLSMYFNSMDLKRMASNHPIYLNKNLTIKNNELESILKIKGIEGKKYLIIDSSDKFDQRKKDTNIEYFDDSKLIILKFRGSLTSRS